MALHRDDAARGPAGAAALPGVLALLGVLVLLAAVIGGWFAVGSLTADEDPGQVADHTARTVEDTSGDTSGDTGAHPSAARDSEAADRGRGDDAPTLDPDTEVSLAVVGDIMLSRAVGERMDSDGTEAVLAGVREQLRDADLTIGNLESPLCEGGTPAPKRFTLKADPVGLEVLEDGSFDVLSLANNHILDYGSECMDSTIELLDDAGIDHVGAGASIDEAREPLIVESKGMRIAFLSYVQMPVERSGFDSRTWTATTDSPGLPWATPEVITEDVEAATSQADHVIVLLHSGWEKTETLSPEQQAAGEAALEAGATAVLGAHPHRLQAHHDEDGSFVAWSMGNFVFDYPDGTPESDSAILHLTLGPEGVTKHEWTPIIIQDGFPKALDPDEGDGARILATLDRMSAEYAATRD